MKSRYIFVLSIFLCLPIASQAKLYRWVDQNGTVHYSQTPPPDQQEQQFDTVREKQTSGRSDLECCGEVESLARDIAEFFYKGGQLQEVHSIARRNNSASVTEIANFVSDKVRLGIDVTSIGQMTYGACSNARLQACARRDFQGQITAKQSTGTGFFVNNQGHLLTNAHVIKGCNEIVVGRDQQPALLIKKDDTNDLALLQASVAGSRAAVLRQQDSAQLGEDVTAVGFPLDGILGGLNVTTGTVSGRSGLHGDSRHIQITAPIQPGNSGGPLLDASGNVIGVIVAKLNAIATARQTGDIPQNVNFAIQLGLVKGFLEQNRVNYTTGSISNPIENTAITRQAEEYTVLIECR